MCVIFTSSETVSQEVLGSGAMEIDSKAIVKSSRTIQVEARTL